MKQTECFVLKKAPWDENEDPVIRGLKSLPQMPVVAVPISDKEIDDAIAEGGRRAMELIKRTRGSK